MSISKYTNAYNVQQEVEKRATEQLLSTTHALTSLHTKKVEQLTFECKGELLEVCAAHAEQLAGLIKNNMLQLYLVRGKDAKIEQFKVNLQAIIKMENRHFAEEKHLQVIHHKRSTDLHKQLHKEMGSHLKVWQVAEVSHLRDIHAERMQATRNEQTRVLAEYVSDYEKVHCEVKR